MDINYFLYRSQVALHQAKHASSSPAAMAHDARARRYIACVDDYREANVRIAGN